MEYKNILEEEIKNTVAVEFFEKFDCTKILGKIDFAVKIKRPKDIIDFNDEYLLWAEAKQKPTDILVMLTQLVLTIGKARTFDEILPPQFLGCYDNKKIAFVPYSEIHEIFYQNDFNWNVTPSNHNTKEFKQIYNQIQKIINNDIPWKTYLFDFEKDEKELRRFIKENFIVGKAGTTKVQIDKNNFIIIYNKWRESITPTIALDWDVVKRNNIIDGDFYLADLLSDQNTTIKENLFVALKVSHYEANRHIDSFGMFTSNTINFKDGQKAYNQFWAKYERPPKEEYWDYIVKRRDLLVPQDVRERKGSFFTPQIWVELSQKYIADVLGKDWQDEYYVWDCAAGTGNLLTGLTNKYNIWASTLDKQDVDVMHDRIKNGANLLESHVFQFDFLNDDFDKLPKGLQDIIANEKKRKKLIIYINPPYAEPTSYGLRSKSGVSSQNKTYSKYKPLIGNSINELFAQFFIRIYNELPCSILASFGTLKYINSQSFVKFRTHFQAVFKSGFVCRANTFDNVKGEFPIGFLIWNLQNKKEIMEIECEVLNNEGNIEGKKKFISVKKGQLIIDWLRQYFDKEEDKIGYLRIQGTDMQQNNTIFVTSQPSESDFRESKVTKITKDNLIEMSIYHTVRHVIESTWLNDRDQFLYPNDGWKTDLEFQNDCLAYTLFSNNIQSKYGVNHWIPFT
ncbi:MAG: hypothetical protein LBT50_06225, partial [Prevotellaceae bacterium]|nr:hypothetical protein [Prevotellaceae bacterium]